MATKTFEELKQLAIQIRDEKTNKQNTATRVGTAMLEHINKLEQDYYDKTKTDEELKERDDKLTELSNKMKSLSLTPGYYLKNPTGEVSSYELISMTELMLVPRKGDTVLSGIRLGVEYNIGFFDEDFNPLICSLSTSGSEITVSPTSEYIPSNAKYMVAHANYGQGSTPLYDRPFAYNFSEDIFTGITYDMVLKFKEIDKKIDNKYLRPLSITPGYYLKNTGELVTYSAIAMTELMLVPKKYPIYLKDIIMGTGYSLGFFDEDFIALSTDLVEKGTSKTINPNDDYIPSKAKYFCAFAKYGQPTENPVYNKPVAYSQEDVFTGITYDFIKQRNSYKIFSKRGYFFNKEGKIEEYLSDTIAYNVQGISVFRLISGVTAKIKGLYYSQSNNCNVVFLDKDRNIIGYTNNQILQDNTVFTTDSIIEEANNSDVKFFAVSVYSNAELVSDYDIRDNSDLILINRINANDTGYLGNVLYKRKWYCCGDSFSAGSTHDAPNPDDLVFSDGIYKGLNKVYLRFISLRNNMDLQLLAVAGATCGAWKEDVEAGTVENPSNTNTFYYRQIGTILENEDSSFDGLITMWFGINDSSHCNLGTIQDETVETFYGALNWSAIQLITNFPYAHIGFVVSNSCSTNFRQAVIEVAKKWAIPYLDMEGEQVPTIFGKRSNQTSPQVDGRLIELKKNKFVILPSVNEHPNQIAHEYQSYFIENWLRSL